MYCINCGKEIPDDSKVCGYCGSNVVNVASYDGSTGQTAFSSYGQQPVYGQTQIYGQQMSGQQQTYDQVQVYSQSANGQTQIYSQQPIYSQPVNGQQPVYDQQQMYGQPGYPSARYTSTGNEKFKPDDKVNIAAFFFGWIWLLIKGMWDAGAIFLGIGILKILIMQILGFSLITMSIDVFISLAASIFWGRNGNYYYRLKQQMGISFIKAIQDPNLRRI